VTELRIRPELAEHIQPIETFQPYPGNARRGDIPKIKRSLLAHGQYKTLLVQASSGHILVGNNTYAAMRELGYEQAAFQVLDVDDAKARELLLMDNASSDESIYDETALVKLLADVADWDGVGWEPDDLDDLLVKLQDEGDPEKLAAALPPEVVAAGPTTLPAVPATDAHHAERPEDEAARQAKFDKWQPRYARGMTEVILVYPEEIRDEVLANITTCKPIVGGQARNGDVVRGALRLMVELVEAQRRGDLAIDVTKALEIARPPDDITPEQAEQAAAAEDSAQEAADGAEADAQG
jgi:hypothetical protein